MKAVRRALEKIELFSALPAEQLDALAPRVELRRYELGDVVCEEGEEGEHFYMVHSGKVRAVKRQGEEEVTLGAISAGGHFGEVALLEGARRGATVRAAAETTLLVLSRQDFLRALDSVPELRRAVERAASDLGARNFFRLVAGFGAELSRQELSAIVENVQEVPVAAGEAFFRSDPLLFVVREGELAIVRTRGKAELGRLLPGDTFGEDLIRDALERDPEDSQAPVARFQFVARTPAVVTYVQPEALERLRLQSRRLRDYLERRARRWDRLAEIELLEGEQELGAEVAAAEADAPGAFPFFPRGEGRGGAACLRMILRHARAERALREVQAAADDQGDATLDQLGGAAERLGLHARVVHLDWAHLQQVALPCVLHWSDTSAQPRADAEDGGAPEPDERYVVLYGLSSRAAWIADPARGLVKLHRVALLDGWLGGVLQVEPRPVLGARAGNPWLSFLAFMRPHRGLWLNVALGSLCLQLLALALPKLTEWIVDHVVVHADLDLLRVLIAGMAVVTVASLALGAVRSFVIEHVKRQVGFGMLRTFYAHLLGLRLPFLQQKSSGDLMARFEDNLRIQSVLFGDTLSLVLDALMALVVLAMMLGYSTKLTGVAVALLLPYALLTLIQIPINKRFDRRMFEASSAENDAMIQAIHGVETVKALGMEDVVRAHWEDRFCRVLNTGYDLKLIRMAVDAAGTLLQAGGSLLILYLGALEVVGGALTVGGLMAFNVLSGKLLGPLSTFLGIFGRFQEATVALERLTEILDAPLEEEGALVDLRRVEGAVRVADLRFGYGEKEVLKGISFEVPAGQTLAVVGRSGSGKSTLAKLLLGQLAPTAGRILLDGVDTAQVRPSSLRRAVAAVPQEPFIFDTTIRENITLGQGDDDERLLRAARLAAATDFVKDLPLGFETVVGSMGTSLSGGQRQRIVIARALYHDPRLLVLDEATSALDTESELAIQQNLAEFFRGRTSVVIAHRLSTVRGADRILVLDEGHVAELGTHDELIARQGLYYHLASQQLGV